MKTRLRVSFRPLGRAFLLCLLPILPDTVGGTETPEVPEFTDTTTMLLPDIEVNAGSRRLLGRDNKGTISLNMAALRGRGRVFGEADPLQEIKSLQGISSGSDYSSGISIDGTDPSQTQYTVDGIPIIFPFRFGGIFSAFNSSHFSTLRFSRLSPSGLSPRLGGAVELETASRFRTGIEGIVNLGIISSSATLRGGLNDRFSLSLSGRISYIDQVYAPILNRKSHSMNFSFSDINAGVSTKLSPTDLLSLTLMYSSDRVGYDETRSQMDSRLNWSNTVAGFSWRHSGRISASADLYYSGFGNTLRFGMTQFTLRAPNSLETVGGALCISGKRSKGLIRKWEGGVRVESGVAVPQWASVLMTEDITGLTERSSLKLRQRIFTGTAFANLDFCLVNRILDARLGLSAGAFRSNVRGGNPWIRPLMTIHGQLVWKSIAGEISFSTGHLQQPLHQVGFSELGLASDFTLGSGRNLPIQSAVPFSFTWSKSIDPIGVRLSLSGYYTLVRNQSEYEGQVIEIIDEAYDPFTRLIISDGHNKGIGMTVERNYGRLTGQLSYGYATGNRHKRGKPEDEWRSARSSGHTLKASLAYLLGDHWELTARYLFSSGRPYTPVAALYMIADNVALEYGKRNSARLPSYSRLDIGATYRVRSSPGITHLLNLSLLNALGNRNVEMQYFILKQEDGSYRMKRTYSLYRFIPSLSYTIEF